MAELVVGGPARPQFAHPVVPELRAGRLRFDLTKTGRRRASAVRTTTYLVPDVGIFQRTGPKTTRLVYAFTRGKKLERRLRFVETAKREADLWFREEMEREVVAEIVRNRRNGR